MAIDDTTTQPATTFTWGGGGVRLTPDEIAARRKVADALAAQGTDSSPLPAGTRGAGVWTQGLARLAKGISAGLDYREADQAAKANADDSKTMLTTLLGGGSAAPAPTAAPTAQSSGLDPETTGYIKAAADKYGVDPEYLSRTAMLESGGNPNAVNPKSGAAGLFQFMPKTAKEYELDNPLDPEDSAMSAAELAMNNRDALASALGRAPTNAELYLAHQQGAGGAAKLLLANPNAPAVSVVGQQAVVDNGGDPTMTAGQFAQKWLGKYGAVPGAPAPSAAPPVQVASNGPVIVPSTPVAAPTDIAPAGTTPPGVAKVAAAMPGGADPLSFAAPSQPAPAAPAAVAKVAAAMPSGAPVATPAPAPAPAAGTPGTARVQAALQAFTSPYADAQTKQVAGMILQQAMKPQAGSPYSDPNLGIVQKGADGTVHVLRPPQAGNAYTDKDGNLMQMGPDGTLHAVIQADKPTGEQKNFEYGQTHPGFNERQNELKKLGPPGATINMPGENKGLDEAAKLDAETVRKGQNEQMPALEDADRNFQIMQDAIDRNGGKLPTGGTLGKLGLDARRTSDYIRNNWGIDLGDDPSTAANLETFNKGGIKASGEMAKAIGGSRVLKVEFDMAQRANPGLETTDGGNKYLIDLNRNTIAIQKDRLQAQEDYWRAHNHSLDGFQKSWNDDIRANPRAISTFSTVPPIDLGDGSSVVKLPSTAQGGYSWYRKGPNGNTLLTDKDVIAKAEDMTKAAPSAQQKPAGAQEKAVGGKNYWKDGSGQWHEDGVN